MGENSIIGKVGIFLLFLLGGIVLSFTSFSATGNVISDLTTTPEGLLGVLLFIAGLFGIVFSRD